MKRFVIGALSLMPFLGMAQESPFVVKGKIGTLNKPAKAYLMYYNGKQVMDSALLVNGAFEFKGNVGQEPYSATLVLDHQGVGLDKIRKSDTKPDYTQIFIEKGTITVTSKDSVSKAKASGTTNGEQQKLNEMLSGVKKGMAAIDADYKAAPAEKQKTEEFRNALAARVQVLNKERKAIIAQFIKANPNSYVSAIGVQDVAGQDPQEAEIMPLISALSPQMQASQYVKSVTERINVGKKTAIGSTAIDFTQNDVNGQPVKLSSFKGKYVLIDFWASWCGPCRGENPNVVKAYNKYKDKNFTVLGVSLDRAKEPWLKAIKDDGLTWTQVSDLKFWKNEVAVQYGIQAIPQNFLIDPTGKIIGKNLRGEELQTKLAQLIH